MDIKRGPKFRLYGEKTKQMRVPISREVEVRGYLHGTRGLREMLKDVRAESGRHRAGYRATQGALTWAPETARPR